ncbi:MAG: type I restriction endonuclease subunit R [Thermoproteota archaeon]|jgi:type I restriction enzyme R subunit|uniref:type I site-specific deoxyribonuclease n=1 Tax=Candidatus Methanodesulfokora washburnensis TaxID=2478471 RepID=A0A429GGE0_9CREN|nr:type I restriction endonuclease [Candidatus Methanodesulfokores washburnensis]RSN72888.1 type I restriction endonuclease subunit R [Candidatus Methanodesulfokores washburnensis]TDA39206.1 MAG: type I restriction endonuclease subunit R [Candidatus Korarchaeota archaeon]
MSGSLIYEDYDVNDLKRRLEGLGWRNGEEYGLAEYAFLPNLIYDKVFDETFEKINENNMKDLNDKEKKEVLNQVKGILRASGEKEILKYLKYGIEVTVKRLEKRTFMLIDFDNLKNNVYFYGHEIRFPAQPREIKPDFTLFINGIPITVIEVEASKKLDSWQDGINQIRRYEVQSPDLFGFVQLGICWADRKLFIPTYPNWDKEKRVLQPQSWKIERDEGFEEDITDLIRPSTLLNMVRWYTFFKESKGRTEKIIARYNQYRAAEKAFNRASNYLINPSEENRKGLIWHWQGSGKTYTMFFIANKFFEKFFERQPLVFFILDRKELQKQLFEDFLSGIDAPKFGDYLKVIENVEELKKLVVEIKRSEYKRIIRRGVYIVLIQKFRREDFDELLRELGNGYLEYLRENDKKKYEELMKELESLSEEERDRRLKEIGSIEKREIILLIDEAHRSQYGILASVMKNIFRNSVRFAFTGTPVFRFEGKNTFAEFSNPPKELYLDIYFIRDSIEDRFTLPIVYDVIQEKGDVKIKLSEEDIKAYIEEWREMSEEEGGSIADDMDNFFELGEEALRVARSEVKRHLNYVKVFLTNKERLKKLAEYIAKRLKDDTENFKFKAMVVAANREACVYLKRFLDEELMKIYGNEHPDVDKWTEIVMSYNQNDIGDVLNYKLELIERRGKTDMSSINSDIQGEFKEKENPRILIVTDMLITGFDAPKLKVMYLDKPLYEHRLLQAIARVNRPYEDGIVRKKMGLIVDSVGLLSHMKDSLKKFELIAEGRIASDLEKNLLGEVKEKVEEFKNLLEEIKRKLKELKLNGMDLSIDLDEMKRKLREDGPDLNKYLDQVGSKLSIIATHWDDPDILRLVNLMRDSIYSFGSLGSNEEKMHYIHDMNVVTWLYGRFLRYLKGRELPKEFWDGLIERIHDKTLIDDFHTLMRVEITNESLKELISRFEKLKAEEVLPEREIADAYHMLRCLLEERTNPIYDEVKERLEELRREWLSRNIELSDAFRLKKLAEIKIKYDEEILNKPVKERIVETVRMRIKQKFNVEPMLQEFRNSINKALKSARIVETHRKEIRTSLMKDLFKEIKAEPKNLKKFAEDITDEYVIEELRREKG